MDTRLYKLYLFKRTAAYFAAPLEQIAEVRAVMNAKQRELGIRDLFNAEMAWSNEKYEYFGVEYYPSLAAQQEYSRTLMSLGFFRFTQGESYLGIPMDNSFPDFAGWPETPPGTDQPIYRVYLSRQSQLSCQLSQEEMGEYTARANDAANMAGIKTLVSAYIRWNNEKWDYFGIERYPSMETLIRYSQFLSDTGWYRVSVAESYLGVPFSGLVSGV